MNTSKYYYYFFSSIFLVIYVVFLTFMPNDWFRDRENYLIYAGSAESIQKLYSGLYFYFNEPLFLKINSFSSIFFDYKVIPQFFVFFISFTFCFNLMKNSKTIIVYILGIILLLTIPYIIQSQLVALRQGLATAIFMWGFLSFKDEKKVAVLILICAFIHSIYFLIFFFYCINFIFFKNLDFNRKLFFNSVGMICFSIFSIAVVRFFGLRQGEEYSENFNQGSGGAFILFVFVFVYLLVYGSKENKRLYDFSILGVLLFLSAYFLTPIAGRFFNTIAPFVVLLLVQRSRLIDILFLLFLSIIFVTLMFLSTYTSLLTIPDSIFINSFFNYLEGIYS